ncbi:MAG: hypothetical protein IJE25_04230 [Clostridia bacterium]|nr:hypothetical protein [Clostridia bacterium]
MYIINSKGIAYHQCGALYIIKPQENPAPKGLMICTALRAAMICQAYGLDKKSDKF